MPFLMPRRARSRSWGAMFTPGRLVLPPWCAAAVIGMALAAAAGAAEAGANGGGAAPVAAPAEAARPGGAPITLQALVEAAMSGHPLARGAMRELDAAKVDVEAAQRRWWPSASLVMESHSTSVNSPASRGAQLEQTLWDGGQINANIDRARADVSKGEARVTWQRQQLALQVIGAWQSLISARDRIAISEATMTRLRDYEAQMRRRVAADASPAVDIELALSRLRQTEVDLTTARSALRLAAQRIEQLSGVAGLDREADTLAAWPDAQRVKDVAANLLAGDIGAQAWDSPAVKMAQGDAAAMRAQLDAKSAQRWPTAYLRVNRPLGDAYPGAGTDRGVSVFVGLRYTPGAGFSTGVEADALRERVSAASMAVDAAWLEQREAMLGDIDQIAAAQNQLAALESAVTGSQHVLDSYSRQFTAGRKTWIDLLNAVRELAQNQYARADSQAALAAAAYRLQVRLGATELAP